MQQALTLWREVLAHALADEGPDLSARQMAILLTVYGEQPPHTVRGLAARLDIPKPAITRALDTLARSDLLRRKRDAEDQRNILVQRTVKGSVFLSEFAETIAAKVREL